MHHIQTKCTHRDTRSSKFTLYSTTCPFHTRNNSDRVINGLRAIHDRQSMSTGEPCPPDLICSCSLQHHHLSSPSSTRPATCVWVIHWGSSSFSPRAARWPWSDSPTDRGLFHLYQDSCLFLYLLMLFLCFLRWHSGQSQTQWVKLNQTAMSQSGERDLLLIWVFTSLFTMSRFAI